LSVALELRHDNNTRWNSTYVVTTRAWEKQEEIASLIIKFGRKEPKANNRMPPGDKLTDKDWKVLAEYAKYVSLSVGPPCLPTTHITPHESHCSSSLPLQATASLVQEQFCSFLEIPHGHTSVRACQWCFQHSYEKPRHITRSRM